MEQLEIRKGKLEEEIRNLTTAIVGGAYSGSIMDAIKVRENELQSIIDHLQESQPISVKAGFMGLREFVLSGLGNLRELLNRGAVADRTELAKHVRGKKLYPEGTTYKAQGDWDYSGDARMLQLRPAVP